MIEDDGRVGYAYFLDAEPLLVRRCVGERGQEPQRFKRFICYWPAKPAPQAALRRDNRSAFFLSLAFFGKIGDG
jgi:hypothetical protein